jgi:hypothetical protein
LQPKSLAGQEKGEERIGNTERGPFGRWRRCSALMIM